MRVPSLLLAPLCFALSQNPLHAQDASPADAGDYVTQAYALAPGTSWTPRGTTHLDARGTAHTRLTQHYDGLPVLGADVVVHVRPGGQRSLSGQPAVFASAKTQPDVDIARATRAAQLAWAKPKTRDLTAVAERLRLASADADATRLVLLDAAYPRRSGTIRLAYEVTVDVPAEHERHAYYVDAESGRVITSVPLLCHANVPGHGETTYYGRRDIALDSVAPTRLLLRDDARGGNRISVQRGYDWDPEPAAATSRDVTGSLPAVAADVAYGTAAFYDMMAERFAWLGIDGAGAPLEAVVFDGEEGQFVNAYWNGEVATFGNGGCHYGPLTTVDVVGHEYLHGVTDYTSDLIYAGESGALNEAMSDIFGKSLERVAHPEAFSWELGNGFADSEYARGFRSMSDPHAYEKPAVYGGEYWEADNGVHTNSAVLNHWFYLLVEGGAGVNDLGVDYDVPALGLDAALAHAFSLQRDYLVSTSTYAAAYASSLEIAEAAYAQTSDEYRAIVQAWRAVGFAEDGGGDKRDVGLDRVDYRMNACQIGLPLELAIWATNAGNVTLAAGTELDIAYDIDYGSFVGEATATPAYDVEPGSTFLLMLATEVVLGEAGYYYEAELTLVTPDDDPSNDELSDYFRLAEAGVEEIRVFGNVDGDLCDTGEEIGGYLYLGNEGCEALPARAYRFNYVTEDGGVLGGFEVDIRELAPGDFAFVGDVAYDRALLSAADDVTLQRGRNPSYDDERLYLSFTQPAILDAATTVALDDERDFGILAPDRLAFFSLGIVERGEGRYWGSVGDDYWAGEAPPCPAAADLFSVSAATSLVTCVDFSAYDAPATVSLEAMHQTSTRSRDFDELSDHYGAVSVSYDDLDGSRLRYTEAGLPSEVPRALSYALPAGYVGSVRIEAYNHHGDGGYDYRNSDFFDPAYDFTFVRNVAFSTGVVGVSEVETRALALAPNPAAETTRLTLPTADAARLRVVDFLGRVVLERAVDGGVAEVSVADWSAGVYSFEASVEGAAVRYVGRLAR